MRGNKTCEPILSVVWGYCNVKEQKMFTPKVFNKLRKFIILLFNSNISSKVNFIKECVIANLNYLIKRIFFFFSNLWKICHLRGTLVECWIAVCASPAGVWRGTQEGAARIRGGVQPPVVGPPDGAPLGTRPALSIRHVDHGVLVGLKFKKKKHLQRIGLHMYASSVGVNK